MPAGLKGYKAHLKFIPFGYNRKLLEQALERFDISAFKKDYERFDKWPIHASAYRLVRILSSDMKLLGPVLNTERGMEMGTAFTVKPTCVMIPTPKCPDKIRVYPNLKINFSSMAELTNACPWTYADVLSDFVNEVNADMESPTKRAAWEILGRARKRLKKYEDIDNTRALLRYTNVKDLKLGEEEIKRIGDNITRSRKPLELIFAKTPAEIIKMYATGPDSCMTGGRNWSWLVTEHKTHPCAFYSYHPYIRGVYILDNMGKVRARTFLYTEEDGKEYYGRMYGNSGNDTNALIRELANMGVVALPVRGEPHYRVANVGYYYRAVEFEIPGVMYAGEYWMPYPFVDNLRGMPIFKWDPIKQVFKVQFFDKDSTNRPKAVSYPNWEKAGEGAIPASKLGDMIACGHCGKAVNTKAGVGQWADYHTGAHYCTEKCIKAVGKVVAYDGENNAKIMLIDDCIRDPVLPAYYTNEEACIRSGGKPVVMNGYDLDEEIQYSHSAIAKDGIAFNTDVVNDYLDNMSRKAITITTGKVEPRIDADFEGMQGYLIRSGEIPKECFIVEDRSVVKADEFNFERMKLYPLNIIRHLKDERPNLHVYRSVLEKEGYYFKDDHPEGWVLCQCTQEYYPPEISAMFDAKFGHDSGTSAKLYREFGWKPSTFGFNDTFINDEELQAA